MCDTDLSESVGRVPSIYVKGQSPFTTLHSLSLPFTLPVPDEVCRVYLSSYVDPAHLLGNHYDSRGLCGTTDSGDREELDEALEEVVCLR